MYLKKDFLSSLHENSLDLLHTYREQQLTKAEHSFLSFLNLDVVLFVGLLEFLFFRVICFSVCMGCNIKGVGSCGWRLGYCYLKMKRLKVTAFINGPPIKYVCILYFIFPHVNIYFLMSVNKFKVTSVYISHSTRKKWKFIHSIISVNDKLLTSKVTLV